MIIKTFDPNKINLRFKFLDIDNRSGCYHEPCPLIVGEGEVISIYVQNLSAYVRTYIEKLTSDFELLVEMPDHLIIPVPIELDKDELNKHIEEGVTIELGGLTTTQFEATVLSHYGQWWFNQISEKDVFNVEDNPMFRRGAQAAHQGVVFCNWLHDQLQKLSITFEQFSNNAQIDNKTLDRLKRCTFIGLPNDLVLAVAEPLNMSVQEVIGQLIEAGALEYKRSGMQGDRSAVVKEVSGTIGQPTSFDLRFDLLERIKSTRR